MWQKILSYLLKDKQVWAVYEMREHAGSVHIMKCYLSHNEALEGLYKLRGQYPSKNFGMQMTRMKGEIRLTC